MAELRESWTSYLDRLTPANLDHAVPYVNSLGESWQNNVQDMLTHVVLHSSYHRGQIAMLLGGEAGYTDFIHCVRQEFIS